MTARVDLHCHSSASYDCRVDPLRLVRLARERGLTHVAITDHETISGALAARAAAPPGITVIVGEEVRTRDGDLVLLYVSEPIPGGLTLEETVSRARQQGCLVGLAHPFDVYRPSIGRGVARHEDLEHLATLADYVEVHNGRVGDGPGNARAADFSREFGLSQVAVTDCHTEQEIGSCYTEPNGDFQTADELRRALRDGTLRVLQAPDPPAGRLRRLLRAVGRLGPD